MSDPRVVVVGGGFSGIAAAVAASKAGARVTLLERADMLAGAGLRAGRLYHNGKIVACEEAKALGVGEVVEALETIVLHRGNIIDEENTAVYHVGLVDSTMRKVVAAAGVELHLQCRATDVEKTNGSLKAVTAGGEQRFEADAFVDASGTFGGIGNCIRYGYGCVMCIHRCPYFGDRVSIATKAGAQELTWTRPDGKPGATGASIQFYKESLSPEIRARLQKEGAFSIPIPEELIDYNRLKTLAAARGPREVKHINLADIGLVAKAVGMGYFPIDNFHKIKGFENAQVSHPMGGTGHGFLHYMSITPREDSLRAKGFANLFIAGDKAGVGGIGEVTGMGVLAGHNAARVAFGREPVELPRTTALGDMIAFRGENMATSEDLRTPISMAHGVFAERMKQRGTYSTEPAAIQKRMKDLGLTGMFGKRL